MPLRETERSSHSLFLSLPIPSAPFEDDVALLLQAPPHLRPFAGTLDRFATHSVHAVAEMFSGWNFVAEVVFTRWAVKWACKIRLKKRLGHLILGDVDLNQIDVQISRGTIELHDLALNVEFLNHKLAGSAVMVKEGSIASLSIKFPWNLKNCEIEVRELEIVLAPYVESYVSTFYDGGEPMENNTTHTGTDSHKTEPETVQQNTGNVSLDIHEGVKKIAKIVKWLLTSFHVRLKNLIVAYDPSSDMDGKRPPYCRSLVIRFKEAEYGTHVSDATMVADSKVESLLGTKLTNFVKFKGVSVDLLAVTDATKQAHCGGQSGEIGTCSIEAHSGDSLLGFSTPVLTGLDDGFSGMVNLSIPWKNGSLDISRADAEVNIDHIKLKIEPNIFNWIIILWESLTYTGVSGTCDVQPTAADTLSSSRLPGRSFSLSSSTKSSDILESYGKRTSDSYFSTLNQDALPDALFPQTNVIQNWVSLSCSQDEILDSDYSESLDLFFSCFDDMRSSQLSTGNSGVWNWTYSVFNAISVVSNLASGSAKIPTEQAHIATNVQAKISGISVTIMFHSEDQEHSDFPKGGHFNQNIKMSKPFVPEPCNSSTSCQSSVNINQSSSEETTFANLDLHHLELICDTVLLNFQVCHQKIKFQASIKHIMVDECYVNQNIRDHENNDVNPSLQIPALQNIQNKVLKLLPQFPFALACDSEDSIVNTARQRSTQIGLVKDTVFVSFGLFSCCYAASYADSDGRPESLTSFSISLPPFLFWIDFQLVSMLLHLSKEIKESLERKNMHEKKNISSTVLKEGVSCGLASVTRGNIEGNIILTCSRIILCFPSEDHANLGYSTPYDKFIAFDSSPCEDAGKNFRSLPFTKASCQKHNSGKSSTSIHITTGNIESYLITSARNDSLDDKALTFDGQGYSVIKFLAIGLGGYNKSFEVTLLWQHHTMTGSWMANRAWSLALAHEQRNKTSVSGFSSLTTAETIHETGCHVRTELIHTSDFFLHIHVPCVSINLRTGNYLLLNNLFDYVVNVFSAGASNTEIDSNKILADDHFLPNYPKPSQVSIFLECGVLDFCITLDDLTLPSRSVQKELQGEWRSFRLTVDKLEILSVSNIGKINNSNLFWLKHGEGELWGSIDGSDLASAQNFVLITCKHSAARRGDGDGSNVLSFGTSGLNITYLTNPLSRQNFTSIIVRCATIISPGGRFDWINAICFFFIFPSAENEQSCIRSARREAPEIDASRKDILFCELVDVALSYQPHIKDELLIKKYPDNICNSEAASVEQFREQSIACFFAAAALYIHGCNLRNIPSKEYKFRLQDVGLHICPWTDSRSDRREFPVDYLRSLGCVKVAQEAFLEAVLRINAHSWEVESSELHVNMNSCRDTTFGLVRLISQLQKLYAPDIEDAMVHLQSRWNTIQKAHMDVGSGCTSTSSSEDLDSSNEGSHSTGLLDDIVEDAFCTSTEEKPALFINEHADILVDRGISKGISISKVICYPDSVDTSLKVLGEKEACSLAMGTPIIDGYCMSESISRSGSPIKTHSQNTKPKCRSDNFSFRETESGVGTWYSSEPLMIVENHIAKVSSHNGFRGQQKEQSSNFGSSDDSSPCGIVHFRNIDLIWRLYAGYDWSLPRNSQHCSNLKGRDERTCLELMLSGMDIKYDIYPDGEVCMSKVAVSAQDCHLFDSSFNAPWKTILGHYVSKDHPRESSSKAFKLHLETVKPDPSIPLEEYRMHLEFLPMRLHLDQRQLNFLVSFFGEDSSVELQRLHDDGKESALLKSTSLGGKRVVEEALLPFFQKCIIEPVVLCIDYIPRHVDLGAALRGGNYAEYLNLVQWKDVELHLKGVCALGLYGWGSICETVAREWLEDISHNQIHKLLKGLPPIKSLLAISSGASKLVSSPVKSYKRDQKLLKGVQRGAFAFAKSISLVFVSLGVHLVGGAHEGLLQTEYILTTIPPSISASERSRGIANIRGNQPKDAHQGIKQAYVSLRDGVDRTTAALVAAPLKAYQRDSGVGSAFTTVVRSVPVAVVAPVTASAHAVRCALLGVRNSLDPERKKESMQKYLGPS